MEKFRLLNMETLKDRLLEVMQELHFIRSKELADFCGVSEGLVTQWFSGMTKLGPKPLKALSKTRFNINWIADGTLPKYRADMGGAHNNVSATTDDATSYKVALPAVSLVYVTARELAVLTKMREATARGVEIIELAVDTAEKDERKIRAIKKA